MAEIVGFRVTIESPDGQVDHDVAWESFSGGGEEIHQCPALAQRCPPQEPRLAEFTLRGPVRGHRKAMMEWIHKAASGADSVRTVTITELLAEPGTPPRDGRRFTYHDCFPTRYVFPRLDAGATCEPIEEVTIKPIRLELS
jgi:hypothetical protein